MQHRIAIVVAYSQNRVIGCDNQLPWRLPGDLAHFKRLTMGAPVVMGRLTRDSLGRPLPGRRNIAITRQADYQADGTDTASSLDQALAMATQGHEGHIFVIGGGQIYTQALPYVGRIYATEVHTVVTGDAFFPPLPPEQWRETERHPQPAEQGLAYDFVVYERRP